jgi:hypothetical protein
MQPTARTQPLGMTMKWDSNNDVISSKPDGICQGCMILRAGADLAKKDGAKADIGSNVYSHHIPITSIGQPQVTMPIMSWCPNGLPGGFDFRPNMKRSSDSMGGMSHDQSRRQTSQPTKPVVNTSLTGTCRWRTSERHYKLIQWLVF